MRPVDRGPAPRQYSKYGDAICDLESRLGSYCSYCERPMANGLAVEHKIPKMLGSGLGLDWTNFLLGCVICNSIKSDTVSINPKVLWPDLNNTLLALDYSKGGFVAVSEYLDSVLERRAKALIDPVGLDRHGANGWPRQTRRDKRWSEREKVWKVAEKFKAELEQAGERYDSILQLAVEAATGFGFFSVWFKVFENHSELRNALINAIPGTARMCFNANANPIPRPNGDI